MNVHIRVFGWLLFGMGSVLTVLGVLAITGLIQVRIDYFGINLDTMQERIAWIFSWMVVVVSGSLLLALTSPNSQNKSF